MREGGGEEGERDELQSQWRLSGERNKRQTEEKVREEHMKEIKTKGTRNNENDRREKGPTEIYERSGGER